MSTVNGSGNGMRSGAQTLTLLAAPLNDAILRGLGEGPKQQTELRRLTGAPAQTTLRTQLKRLIDAGALEKRRRNRFPGVLDYQLIAAGRDLLSVADVLERWLAQSPEDALPLGDRAARAAVKALAEGWATMIVRALAAKPLSLTELNEVIGCLSYPALQRRLAAMRLAGLVETRRIDGRGAPYAVTEWLRRGVAPLTAASRWERLHAPAGSPLGRLDAESAFLLTMPLLRLPDAVAGSCRLGVELGNGDSRRVAGVTVEAQAGRIASCTTRMEGRGDAWILGSSLAWLSALFEGDVAQLELGGSCDLARAVLDELRAKLFEPRAGCAAASG